jgi:uncharacterized membrane protein YagU involved in acid resistance
MRVGLFQQMEASMALSTSSHVPVRSDEYPWALRQGAIGGIVAGLIFAAFEMIASAMMQGAGAFFMPLRMIGAIALGPAALEPSYSLLVAGVAGVGVHMVLAIVYGAVFAALFCGLRSVWLMTALGAAYGTALWLINFYLIAPAMLPWFQQANQMLQFWAHAVFFGAVLGFWVWRTHEALLRRGP